MTSADRLRSVVAAGLAIAALSAGLGCQSSNADPRPALISDEPLMSDAAPVRSGSGRVVQGPAQITAFAPADTSVRVDAATVNLRQVFEDLGDDATLWYQHVQTLANPFFEGRAPETHGAELAADYIEFWLKHYGLEPAFPGADDEGAVGDQEWVSYQQPFEYTRRGTVQVKVNAAELTLDGDPLAVDDDFVVLGISGDGDIEVPITFVGYGIADGPDGYTSFDEDTDLAGRAALLLRYTPLDDVGEATWGENATRRQGGLARKLKAVADRGAAAIILVNPPGAAQAPDGLESVRRSVRFGPGLNIPVLQVTPETADRLLAAGDPGGDTLMEWRRRADRGVIGSIDLANTTTLGIRTAVDRKRDESRIAARNVGAVLRGQGDLADEWIVIGGHYDHVGTGKHGGTTPGNRGQMHNGADDNASGTAGVLVLAKTLSEAYAEARQDLRSVLFIAFDAEEMGLHGSRYFTENSTILPEKMSLLLNMDMVGRLRGGNLSVLGTATGEGLEEMLETHFLSSGLTVSVTPAGSGRSDDANFHAIGVPAVHFFTGMHPLYTTPGDEAYTVNPAGAGLLLGLMLDIALDAATMPQRLKFQEPPRSEGRNRGYGRVRLGIQPDMEGEVEGVVVGRVSEGTSADDAGMLDGDVIVSWDGHPVRGLQDLFQHLQTHEPGDRVKLTVLRDGRRIELGVTLKAGGDR